MNIVNREFLPSSTSKYVKDYFEAIGHYNSDEYQKAVDAAKVNLADETTPRALQIRNYILVAAASDDDQEVKEARQAAEKIWQAEKNRIEHETRALNDLREALDELDKDESEEEDTQVQRLLPSSTSKYVKDYFAAVEHYNHQRFPETVTAARINLTDETCPRALQIKNYIIVSAATEDENEAKEAREAAERIWEDAKARIPAGPEYDYEREGIAELRGNIDELDNIEEEESDLEEEDFDMEEDEIDDEDEVNDEVENEERTERRESSSSAPLQSRVASRAAARASRRQRRRRPCLSKHNGTMVGSYKADFKSEGEPWAGGPGGN